MDTQRPVDVFVSYSRKDREFVGVIGEALTRHGYEVWFDREIGAGKDFAAVIEEALHQAAVVIVVWSGDCQEFRVRAG